MTKVLFAVLICSALQACASAPQKPPMPESMYEAYARERAINQLCFDHKYMDPAFFAKAQDAILEAMILSDMEVDAYRFAQMYELKWAAVKGGVPSEKICRNAIAKSHSRFARFKNF